MESVSMPIFSVMENTIVEMAVMKMPAALETAMNQNFTATAVNALMHDGNVMDTLIVVMHQMKGIVW